MKVAFSASMCWAWLAVRMTVENGVGVGVVVVMRTSWVGRGLCTDHSHLG
jgi:hypothetical protein